MAAVFGLQIPYLDQVQTQAVIVGVLAAAAVMYVPGILNQVVTPTRR